MEPVRIPASSSDRKVLSTAPRFPAAAIRIPTARSAADITAVAPSTAFDLRPRGRPRPSVPGPKTCSTFSLSIPTAPTRLTVRFSTRKETCMAPVRTEARSTVWCGRSHLRGTNKRFTRSWAEATAERRRVAWSSITKATCMARPQSGDTVRTAAAARYFNWCLQDRDGRRTRCTSSPTAMTAARRTAA